MLMTETPSRDEATTTVCHGARLQPYRLTHKALRTLMFRTLQQLATLDASDAAQRRTMVAEVSEMLQVCADHLAHENCFFHTTLRERAPRAVLPFEDDHHGHAQCIAELQAELAGVAKGGPAVRGAAYALYLKLSRFVGESLEHMADEETRLTQAFWQHFDDGEIAAIEQRLHATFSVEKLVYYTRWMARSLDDSELQTLAAGAQAAMPPDAFGGLWAVLMDELPPPRRARLARALGMAAVPGLMTA